MNIEVSKEAVVDFAKFIYTQHGYLEPWAKSNAETYDVDKSAFGGSPPQVVQGYFYRMTAEEYEAETGESLPHDNPSNWPKSTDNWYTGDVGSFVGGTIGGFFSDDLEDMKKWWDYRNASGTWSDADDVEAPSISGSEAPWAQTLHDDWKEAVRNRCTEVDSVRDEIETLTPKLVQAAEDYMGTDLSNATGLDLSRKGLDKSHEEVEGSGE